MGEMAVLSDLTDPADPADASAEDAGRPLIVELDRCLLRTHSTLESLFALARRAPLQLLAAPGWLARGAAHFKHRLNGLILPAVDTLPYRGDLIAWLRHERARGRSLVLATSADRQLADAVARHVGLFDRVLASDGVTCLSGSVKRDRLVAEFGHRRFDYACGRTRDRSVWPAAQWIVVVPGSRGMIHRISRTARVALAFEAQPTTLPAILREMRIHHWVKNLLIFTPVAAAHRLMPPDWVRGGVLGFLAFSLGASSVYVLNDLLDLDHDRAHPDKKERMIASGRIDPGTALALLAALMIASAGLAAALPHGFAAVLGAYFVLMIAYSTWLKDLPVLDVSTLAMGYALRVVAGAIATGIALSPWTLAIVALLFLSLSLVKRCGELERQIRRSGAAAARLYGYRGTDAAAMRVLGVASGYLAVVVLAIYTNTPVAESLFPRHRLFWIVCALLLYWINHLWFAVSRGAMPHDPVVYALTDTTSRWLLAAMAAVTLACLL